MSAVPAEVSSSLVDRVQHRLWSNGPPAAATGDLQKAVAAALRDEGVVLPAADFAAAVRAVTDELTGLGPLAPLLADPTVTDVLVNGPGEVWVDRQGRLEPTAVRLPSTAALATLVQRVVAPLGLRIDEARPWVDARLPGGQRFHAVLPPIAPDGPLVTIRTFSRRRLGLVDLIEGGTMDATTGRLLEAMVAAGVATAISGATGSGKTTMLNVLGAAIPRGDRVVVVEDAAELQLPGRHVVRLEARPPNVEGRGEVPLRELVRNALRMRPDRIVVGEVRGAEAFDLLQAANTGHRGLLTTLHAGGPDEIPARLEAMALAAPGAVLDVVRRLIAGGLGAAVHLERGPAGRRVTAVAELVPDERGRARARLVRASFGGEGLSATGHVPTWADRLDSSVRDAFDSSAGDAFDPSAGDALGRSVRHAFDPSVPAGDGGIGMLPAGRR
ncbi:MAG TPA: CpaF family protein [Actinomycetota bacterium]|jgi:pilus assembly protein CpaF|nr:CpaF family protein [Actinomycetota bacterium]